MTVGIIGIWRAIRSSGLFFFGSIAIMFALSMLILFFAVFSGPFFYFAQKNRVNKLKEALEAAQVQRAVAYKRVHYCLQQNRPPRIAPRGPAYNRNLARQI